MYTEISKCRICDGKNLDQVLSLGNQTLTGVFPKSKSENVTAGPVDLVKCKKCDLVQLKQSYSIDEMYGDNYGYRSGLNKSMVEHLSSKIQSLEKLVQLSENDIVIDIGSNDATSLRAYSGSHMKIGIDPTGKKFKSHYAKDMVLIPEFFNAERFRELFPNNSAKIITSIAMFYDLESPTQFASDIAECLHQDGIWHFEQSYLPTMLELGSYDTICHEHLEFYSLHVVKSILNKAGLKIIDVHLNSINGGSFAVTACKLNAKHKTNVAMVNMLLDKEVEMGVGGMDLYREFERNVIKHRDELRSLVLGLVQKGKKVFGYGASTKGNVLLQYCKFTSEEIKYIAEVNPDKYEKYTPGSHIPIISEKEAKKMEPDYYLVLPWHFREGILERETESRKSGVKFIFPFPEIEII
jgi:hypothetical protein